MENQRVRLTKSLLKNALTDMLKEKELVKISVRELCDIAEINRTTFYKYYGSQFDLFTEMEEDLFLEIEKNLVVSADTDKSIMRQRFINLLTYFQNNREFCQILVNTNTDNNFPKKLLNFHPIKDYLSSQIASDRYSAAQADYVYDFIVHGGYQIAREWMNKDEQEQPEELADFIMQLVNTILYPLQD